MEPLVFNFPKTETEKTKISKRVFIVLFVVVLLAAILAGYFMLVKIGKMSGVNLMAMAGKFIAISNNNEKTANIENGNGEAVSALPISLENEKVVLPSSGKIYKETAGQGESITRLARKALKEHLKERGANLNLTPEHKIYIEDYLQNKTGDYWLRLGEEVNFSEDLMVEAIHKAQQLNSQQLENLTQYSNQVSF